MNFWRKRTQAFDFQITRKCKHCEASFQGKFCNICGEKVLEKEDQTLKNYLLNLLNAYTFIDGKFFNSLKTLTLNPGKITADISDGITVPYMQPISFFVPSIRRVMEFTWWRSILGGILLVSALIVVITIYRLTLFLATFYTL
ncbi:DUF3667 domain-containing protein [Algoriphagus sp.]|uniref:DUF3667 domain-containing protein n=1 Tax=Algoriphagus sp. TaxID=1872435 RepID=UPI00391D226F